jgi:hypothetical protein
MSILKSFSYDLNLSNNVEFKQNFNEFLPQFKPNTFQIRNFSSTEILYVSTRPNVSSTNFEVSILAGATRVFTVPYQLNDGIYLKIGTNAKIQLNAFFSDNVNPSDLDQTQQSIIVNYSALPEVKITDGTDNLAINTNGSINTVVDDSTPIDVNVTNASLVVDDSTPIDVNVTNASLIVDDSTPIDVNVTNDVDISFPHATAKKVTLVATVPNVVKNNHGYIFAIKTALTDLEITDNSVVVWEGEYNSAHPFYNSDDITLVSATGGDAYIVYK